MLASASASSAEAGSISAAQDREVRLRFMRIGEKTGELLREFWPVAEAGLPAILEGFYQHIAKEPRLARLIGNDIRVSSPRKDLTGSVCSTAALTIIHAWCAHHRSYA